MKTRSGQSLQSASKSSQRPRNVAMLAPCPFPTRQGTQVFIRHLASAMAQRGHKVHLIAYGQREYDEEYSFVLHRSSKLAKSLRSGPSLAKPAADAELLWTAAKVVRAYRCELIHAHNAEGLGVGALLKAQTGLPLVYHAHNAMGPELPTYFRAHLVQAFASVFGEALDRTLPKAADAIITFDERQRQSHIHHVGDPERVHAIPPGLFKAELAPSYGDSSVVPRAAPTSSRQGPYLLYAGNPDRYQNLGLLWRAFRLVYEKRPAVTLLVVSNHPPNAFEAELGEAQLGSARRSIAFKRIESVAELRKWFHVADIGVCPRTLAVGAPIKVLNYLEAGLPVVACRSGAGQLLNGEAGQRLTADDPESFAAGILQALADDVRVSGLPDRFRIESQLPRYEAVYSDVLERLA